VPPSAPFAQLLELCINTRYQNVYVTDAAGRFLGAVPLQTIKQMLTNARTSTPSSRST